MAVDVKFVITKWHSMLTACLEGRSSGRMASSVIHMPCSGRCFNSKNVCGYIASTNVLGKSRTKVIIQAETRWWIRERCRICEICEKWRICQKCQIWIIYWICQKWIICRICWICEICANLDIPRTHQEEGSIPDALFALKTYIFNIFNIFNIFHI